MADPQMPVQRTHPAQIANLATENGRESLQLVSNIRFEQMEHEFPFGTFRPEKQDYLVRRSVAPGNFPLEQPEKSCTIYFPTEISGKFL